MYQSHPIKTLEDRSERLLGAFGLVTLGWFRLEPNDCGVDACEDAQALCNGRHAGLLIGNRAENGRHRMWEVFSRSAEFGDGLAHGLDRWSERVIGKAAGALAGTPVFPFGNLVWPFQQFAVRATGCRRSPLGLLIHPEFGLWFAFRGAIVFPDISPAPRVLPRSHPCMKCEAMACFSTCPVNAFTSEGYDVAVCREHVGSGREPVCSSAGCRARAACPLGIPYGEEQIRFHMTAFSG